MLKGKTRIALFCLLALLLVALPLLAAACGDDDDDVTPTPTVSPTPTPTVSPTPTPTPTPVPTGTLTMAMSRLSPVEFQAWSALTPVNRQYVGPMADYLTYTKHDTHELIPGLATRWEVSEDKKSISFFLREGVQFHDGWGELTSEDVKFTIETAMSYKVEGASPRESDMAKNVAPYVDRVETNGPYEIVMHFKDAPWAEFAPHWFSAGKGTSVPITSKKHVEAVGFKEANLNKPIFSGPYKYVDHAEMEYIKLEAVENHWRVVPEYKYLMFKEVPEEMTRVAMFKRGDVDIAEVRPEAASQLAEEEGVSVVAIPDSQSLFLALFGQYLPTVVNYDPDVEWLDIKVRQAMNLAINREEIAEFIFRGYAKPGTTPYPWPWSDELEPYPYDPDRARELLEEAGYAGGFEVELQLWDYPGQAAAWSEVAQAVAGYWDAIGLDTKIETVLPTAFYLPVLARAAAGLVGTVTAASRFEPWGQDFDRVFNSFTLIMPIYESYELDELVEQRQAATNVEEMDRLARQMSQLVYDEYAVAPLVIADKLFVKNTETVGDWVTIEEQTRLLNWEYITHPTPLGTFRLFEP